MKPKEILQYCFGALILILYFGVITLLFLKPIPEPNRDVLIAIAGALTGLVITIGNYYWGSSAGSAAKDKTITEMIANDKG